MSRRYDRRLRFILPGVFAGVATFAFLSQGIKSSTDAASLDKFDPGNIISDYTMGNYEAMTEEQIQEFLTTKNSCKNTDKTRYDELTAAYKGVYTWHWKDNHFVCLSEELFGDGEVIGEGETAAHIIWQAAQDYKINPQVLLVLLQKETSLITDPIPNDKDYRKAAGYGCPDTAACNEKYYGFKNQVRNAANLFHVVLTGGWTNYPLGQNYIQYNPNAACGGSMVEIKNLATSSLYRYTPYQPNAGTIAAGYGTAECGAYGNRNFYLYFSDWFGDPTEEKNPLDDYEKADLADGSYYLQLKTKTNLYFGADSNNKLQLLGSQQEWLVRKNPNGTYAITGAENQHLSINKEGKLVLSSEKTSWTILKLEDKYVIKDDKTNKVFSIVGTGNKNDKIELSPFDDSDTQKWSFKATTEIEEGEYLIKSALNDDRLVDISGGVEKAKKGTNINTWRNNGTEAQVWKITKNPNGTYTIKNPATDKVFGIEKAKAEKSSNIVLIDYKDECSKQWRIIKTGEHYTLLSACDSGLTVDIEGGSTEKGANIRVWSTNGTGAQQWSFVKKETKQAKTTEQEEPQLIKDGIYRIYSASNKDRVIDISGGTKTAVNGNKINLWRNNGTEAQHWQVTFNKKDNTYTFVNPDTKKALDVDGASTKSGAAVHLWRDNGTCAQKWRIAKKDDAYIITSSCSELVLEATAVEKGAGVQIGTQNGSDKQSWNFELIGK